MTREVDITIMQKADMMEEVGTMTIHLVGVCRPSLNALPIVLGKSPETDHDGEPD